MVKIEKQQDPSNEDVVTEVTKSKSDKRKRSADNMVPSAIVERLELQIKKLRRRVQAQEKQEVPKTQVTDAPAVKPEKIDAHINRYASAIPLSNATDSHIAEYVMRFKQLVLHSGVTGRYVRTHFQNGLAASRIHSERFKALMKSEGFSDSTDENNNIVDDITFKQMLAVIEKFQDAIRPSVHRASMTLLSMKFDPTTQTGEQFINGYVLAVTDAKPKERPLEDYLNCYATSAYGLLRLGAEAAGLSAAVQDIESAHERYEGPMTMEHVTKLARSIFKEVKTPKEEPPKLFQMRQGYSGPFPGQCYNCGERGHKSIACTRRHVKRRSEDTSDDEKSVVSQAGSGTVEKRRTSLAKKFNPGSGKTADSKKARRLLVLRFSGKLILVDTGAQCSVWFTNKIDWKTKLFSLTTVDTLGGLVPARQLLEPFEVIPGLWMSKIMVVEDNPIVIDGEVIEVIMGIDAMWLAGGFNLWLEESRGDEKAYIQFRFSPEVYSISEETLQASHGEKFLHFQVLHTIQSGTEKLKIPQFDLEDVHACPPGAEVVDVMECKDFRLSVVKPPKDSKLRLVVKYKTKANQGIKARFGKGHYFDRLSDGDLQLVLAKIKEWISEGRCVPVERQYVKSIIPVFCVLQKHKESTPARPVFNAAFNINLDILSYPSEDVGAAPHCANRIRLIRAMPELDTSVDVRGYYLGFWNNPEQSFYLCLHLPGLGLPSEYWRMVGMPFGLASAPKIGQVGMAYMLRQAGLENKVVDYVDDLFAPKQDIQKLVDVLQQYGFRCKPATPVDNHQFLGIKTRSGKISRLKPLPEFWVVAEGEAVTLQAVRSYLGKLLAHYPIAGWLRPWCGLITRVVALIRRIDREKSASYIQAKTGYDKATRLQHKLWEEQPDTVVHPLVVSICRQLHDAIIKRGDPVSGQLHFNILADMELWIDSSMFAMGAKLFVGGVLVEDGSWMLPAAHSCKLYSEHHINVNEAESAPCGLKLVKRVLDTEAEFRRRKGLPARGTRQVTIFSDSHSWCTWIRRVLKEEDPCVPELSRRLVNHRLAQCRDACQRLKIDANVVWVPGSSNKADEMTRVPDSVLKIVAEGLSKMGCAQTVINRVLAMTVASAEVQGPNERPADTSSERCGSSSLIAAAPTGANLTINGDRWEDCSAGVHRVISDEEVAESLCPGRDTRLGQRPGNPFVGVAVKTTSVAVGDVLVDGLEELFPEVDYVDDTERAHAWKVYAALTAKIPVEFLVDNEGRALLQEEAEFQRVLQAVHVHEGGDALYKVAREIVSPESPLLERDSLRERCRAFVRQCEACQMCRRVTNFHVSARAPIRLTVHGEQIGLSQAQIDSILKTIEKENLPTQRAARSAKRSAMSGQSPWEKLSLDIVGPWTVGTERMWLITGLDTFSQFFKVQGFINSPPTTVQCVEFFLDFVREGGRIPLVLSVDNGATFAAQAFQAVVQQMGVELEFVGAYYHERLIERMHRVLNERTRASIHALRSLKQQQRGVHHVAMPVSASEVLKLVSRVVAFWNVAPRDQRKSPHSLLYSYPAWIYHSIQEYRPKPYQPILRQHPMPVVGENAPQPGELWRVAVKPGEHASANVDDVLSPKLKPNHVYGRVVEVLTAGRYLMKLEGMTKFITKQRRQLVRRCVDSVIDQSILDRNPVVLPEAVPLIDADDSDISVVEASQLARRHVKIDTQRMRPSRTRKRNQRIFGPEFETSQ